jgi:hypothetical protein
MYYHLICILYALLCGQNFILVKSGCYMTARKFDSIQEIVDQFTKSAQFILVHNKYRAEKYAEIYIARI